MIHPDLLGALASLRIRVLSEKGSSPAELGVIWPKTANMIGLLPVNLYRNSGKSHPLDFLRDLNVRKGVREGINFWIVTSGCSGEHRSSNLRFKEEIQK